MIHYMYIYCIKQIYLFKIIYYPYIYIEHINHKVLGKSFQKEYEVIYLKYKKIIILKCQGLISPENIYPFYSIDICTMLFNNSLYNFYLCHVILLKMSIVSCQNV